MDHAAAQDWLDRYVAAWMAYDPGLIGDLFTEDVAYRYHPYEPAVLGREAVVSSWLGDGTPGASARDAPGTAEATYAPVAVDGNVVVATGRSSYRDEPGGPVVKVFHNCMVITFDDHGRCRDYTEYYMKQP